ncbi:MAG: hypothetical protein Ct9H300mP27_08200 [Chloroflexota bacterium]|nr:MAG: hypothetical protein Ct9H300mP27_08200 [Chloroflexota bacterium]
MTKGIDAMGAGPLDRAYEANDGWVYIHADVSDLAKLSNVEGLSGIEPLVGGLRCFDGGKTAGKFGRYLGRTINGSRSQCSKGDY